MTRQLLQSPWYTVFASYRSPSTATGLGRLTSSGPGKLHVIKLDVTDKGSIKTGATEVRQILDGQSLNYVINNAAVNLAPDTAFTFEPEHSTTSIASNVIGPELVAGHLLSAIGRSDHKPDEYADEHWTRLRVHVNELQNQHDSIEHTYKQVNERPEFITLLIDPGWVKTEMDGPGAVLEPRINVKEMLNVITNATTVDAGKFYNYQGKEIP